MTKKYNRTISAKKKYKLVIYETFHAAKEDRQNIINLSAQCDQLNICIREEGDMDDQDLVSLSPSLKVFAGQAWTVIHERRKEDGWYDSPQE